MNKVWKSGMSDNLKCRLFVTTVESVLVYGCEAWTLTVKDKKALDGVYTRMLRAALNVSWEDHIRNVDLYGFLPKLTLSGNGAWDSLDTAWDTQSSLPVNSSYGNPPTEEDPEVDLMQHTSTHWSRTLDWTAWLKYDLSWRKERSGGLLSGVPESAFTLVSCSPDKVLRYIYIYKTPI